MLTTTWRKSSRSGSTGDCVEVARLRGGSVAVRDSRDTTGPVLVFDVITWRMFVEDLRS